MKMDNLIKMFPFMAAVVVGNLVWAQRNENSGSNPPVLWSNASNICLKGIQSLIRNVHIESVDCFFNGGTSISNFDIDMADRKAVVADGKYIHSLSIGSNPTKELLLSSPSTVTGIAMNWMDDSVYWCMGENDGKISVFSMDTYMISNLIDTNLISPKDIDVAPHHNVLVWISGPLGSQKIEKSKLDDSDRVTLFTSRSSLDMKGLAVDSSTTTVYFIDNSDMRSCDLEGKQLTIIRPTSSVLSPSMILPYKNFLFMVEPSVAINIYEKRSDPRLRFQISSIDTDTITDMHVLDTSLQPDELGPCDIRNGDCDQICIPDGSIYRKCQCEQGYQLHADSRACVLVKKVSISS